MIKSEKYTSPLPLSDEIITGKIKEFHSYFEEDSEIIGVLERCIKINFRNKKKYLYFNFTDEVISCHFENHKGEKLLFLDKEELEFESRNFTLDEGCFLALILRTAVFLKFGKRKIKKILEKIKDLTKLYNYIKKRISDSIDEIYKNFNECFEIYRRKLFSREDYQNEKIGEDFFNKYKLYVFNIVFMDKEHVFLIIDIFNLKIKCLVYSEKDDLIINSADTKYYSDKKEYIKNIKREFYKTKRELSFVCIPFSIIVLESKNRKKPIPPIKYMLAA